MTKVKICGLSTKEAVETAVSAGADYIGFVFAPSKRQVTLDQAAELAKLIPVNVKKVGVFVSPSRAELLEAIDKVGLDLAKHFKADCLYISESAIFTGQDAERVAPYFNGILVGTALMQAEDVAQRIKELQIDKG